MNENFFNFSLKARLMNYSLLYFLFFAIQQSMNWPLLNYWGIRGPIRFWDANVVLTMSDCYLRVGLSVFNTFKGDTCTGYMYGSELLRTLSYLNIGVNNTYVIGWIFLTILALIFGFLTSLLNPPNFLTGFLISLIFISPPILLLVERGNFDSLIFILFFGAVISFKYWYSFPSFLIILLISTWKFYTLPLAALMLLKIKNPYLRIPGYRLFTFSLSFKFYAICKKSLIFQWRRSLPHLALKFGGTILINLVYQ